MNYAVIKKADIANGPGVRVSLFVSGCTHHCPGCFNAEAWDFGYGEPYTPAVEEQLMCLLRREYVRGLSLLGGEPLEPEHQQALLPLLRRLRLELPEKTIWCYTGYILETELLSPDGRAHTAVTQELLHMLDVLVDGRFEQNKSNIRLLFRGSENQRLLDMHRTLETGSAVLLDETIIK